MTMPGHVHKDNDKDNNIKVTESSINRVASRGGQMSRVPTSHLGKSGNPKIAGLSLEPTGLKPG